MADLTLGGLIAVIGMFVSLCSIASFYFGRKKATADDARETGGIMTDLKYIKESVEKTSRSLEDLSKKMDNTEKKYPNEKAKGVSTKYTKLK